MIAHGYGEDRGLYRSREGIILGVCRGVADYFDFSVFWVRVIVVSLLLLSGIWPVLGVYVLASLLMKPKPIRPIHNDEEQEFYDTYVYSPKRAAHRLKRRYEDLDRRLRRMEDAVTSREFDWDRRMNA